VLALASDGLVRAAAHVTGGGLPENLPRVLPAGLGAEVREGSWPVPPVFDLVREAAGASAEDMRATFNMGIGMVLVAPSDRVPQVLERSTAAGTPAFEIGRVLGGDGLRYT
jgi:phosphoribosylformylglycinamidine cyclo-ligase